MVSGPLPGSIRRELRHYPFKRIAHHILVQEYPKQRTPRVYKSREEEIRIKRVMLRDTLLSNLYLGENLRRFIQDFPDAVAWVKARVPPETWARLEEPSEMVLPREPKKGHAGTESSDGAERPES